MNGHSGTTGSPRARSASSTPLANAEPMPLALEGRVDLGVHEVDATAAAVVHGEAGELAVDADLVAVLVGDSVTTGELSVAAIPSRYRPRPPPRAGRR